MTIALALLCLIYVRVSLQSSKKWAHSVKTLSPGSSAFLGKPSLTMSRQRAAQSTNQAQGTVRNSITPISAR
jgi:hypothetical protein